MPSPAPRRSPRCSPIASRSGRRSHDHRERHRGPAAGRGADRGRARRARRRARASRRRDRRRRRGRAAHAMGLHEPGRRRARRGRPGDPRRLTMAAPIPLVIGGRAFGSRLILGTGGFTRLETLAKAIEASGTEMVTVALRRIDPAAQGSLIGVLDDAGVAILPNTAGCFTARDAVRTAKLAREAFETDWIKLEVIGDERTLLPDAPELLAAAEELVAD